jgi:lipopolysaccharide export LptBFGC system permease protein LptF
VHSRVIKKLDILIVKAFVGPFVATFFITTFVLVLQFMWLYIDDVVGKGVDAITVLRLLMYVAATMVPLSLPLAVLLSSIMTLGNLGETYELVAIKSAGISLLRFLRPLFVVSLLITVIAFFFNNNILPIANLKMNTIKYDIIVTKPAFDIKEGVFYDRIEGFVIKIGKKEQDDSTIRSVVIYEQNSSGQQDNMIIADSGTMVVTPDKQSLIFTLKNGTRYQEKNDRANAAGGSELVRMNFKTYKKVMDLSSFRLNKTDDSTFKHNFQMLSILQLGRSIDSIKQVRTAYVRQSEKIAGSQFKFPAYLDTSGWADVEKTPDAPSRFLLPIGWARDSVHKAWVVARHVQDSVQKVHDSLRRLGPGRTALPATVGGTPATAGNPAPPATAGRTASPPGQGPGWHTPTGTAPATAGNQALATVPKTPPGSPTAVNRPNNLHPTKTPKQPGTTAAVHPLVHTPLQTPSTHNQTLPHPFVPGQTAVHPAPPPFHPTQPAVHGNPATVTHPVTGTAPLYFATEPLPVPKDPPGLSMNDLVPDSMRTRIIERSISAVNAAKVSLYQPVALYDTQNGNLRQHEMAWHEKITLAIACMVMFLIGAPLGSIIRRGGIGLPLVFAVIFFIIFFLLNNFGRKFVSQDVMTPVAGMWMSTYVLTPIGLFLIYKALHDSQLFNKEFYFRLTRRLKAMVVRISRRRRASVV